MRCSCQERKKWEGPYSMSWKTPTKELPSTVKRESQAAPANYKVFSPFPLVPRGSRGKGGDSGEQSKGTDYAFPLPCHHVQGGGKERSFKLYMRLKF